MNTTKVVLRVATEEIGRQLEVEAILGDIVDAVEFASNLDQVSGTASIATVLRNDIDWLVSNTEKIIEEKVAKETQMKAFKAKAESLRENFVANIGHILKESKRIHKLHEKISKLEHTLCDMSEELGVAKERIANYEREELLKNRTNLLFDTSDNNLLHMFSFLEITDVLSSSLACRFMYDRVYRLFGIESTITQPSWSERPDYSKKVDTQSPSTAATVTTTQTTSSDSASSADSTARHATAVSASAQSAGGLTREMADALTKKLSPAELKAVAALTDRVKRQNQQIETLVAEKEDVTAKLQNAESVKDFFIEKLGSAEMALKSAMHDISILKKQALADHEVISYLDIRGQELEGSNDQLTRECDQLRATVDLQLKSSQSMESQLQAEIADLKQKLEQSETNAKSQKKVLVKEVKSLRVQLDTIALERNLYSSQLQTLRDALNGTTLGLLNSNSANGSALKR